MNIDQNINFFKIVRVLTYTSFWGPALYLFFTNVKGFSPIEALAIPSIYSIGVVIFEIPTGMVADVFSRKLSLALGTATKGLAIFLMMFVPSYWFAFLLALLMAIGESLVSGSDTSILYDTLIIGKREPEYKKIISHASIFVQIYMGICALTSGIFGEINLALPLAISLPFYLIGSYFASKLVEPENIKELRQKKDLTISGQFNSSIKSLYLKNGKPVWNAILLTIAHFFIMGFVNASIFWMVTPIFTNFAIGIGVIGSLILGFRLMKSLGSWLITKMDDKNDYRAMILSTATMAILVVAMMIFQNVWATAILFGLVFMTQVFYQVNYDQYTNAIFKSEYRATLNSIQSMFMKLWAFIMLPAFGYLLENVSYGASLGLLVGSLVVGLGLLISRKNLNVKDTK